MEPNYRQILLDSFGKIYEESKDCKLPIGHFEKLEAELRSISNYFNTSETESFFIAMIFALNCNGRSVDMNDLRHYIDCSPMMLLGFKEDFDRLCNTGILFKEKARRHQNFNATNEQYSINPMVSNAILQNQPLPQLKNNEMDSVAELLEKLSEMLDQRSERDISSIELHISSSELLQKSTHFPLVERILKMGLEIENIIVFLSLVWKNLEGKERLDLNYITSTMFDSSVKRFKFMQGFIHSSNPLLQNGLIEIQESNFYNDTEVTLSENAKIMLEECGLKLYLKIKKRENVISPEQISDKKLIFNEGEMIQLDLLRGLLFGNKLNEMQERLSAKGLPKGINVLLHGASGTGKTETVLQMAKETGREIMKVEISQAKSMWFGESEKVIKRIFNDYKAFMKSSAIVPILFFNEADAIISKRRNIGNSSVSQTENAIQNIILEELENFEGILMATTNLANNMDSAFERRFLFKVEFVKPDQITKSKIWKLKMPILSDLECEKLSKNFDFSGAQIDNIIRKQEIFEILYGGDFNFAHVIGFCEEELLNKESSKIGF
jgi:hypothetical protein